MSRREHRYYKIKKKTGDSKHIKCYPDLEHELQKRHRQAYWKNVEDIVITQDKENEYAGMKRYRTYIKHRGSDNVGICSIKSEGKLFKVKKLRKDFHPTTFLEPDNLGPTVLKEIWDKITLILHLIYKK